VALGFAVAILACALCSGRVDCGWSVPASLAGHAANVSFVGGVVHVACSMLHRWSQGWNWSRGSRRVCCPGPAQRAGRSRTPAVAW